MRNNCYDGYIVEDPRKLSTYFRLRGSPFMDYSGLRNDQQLKNRK